MLNRKTGSGHLLLNKVPDIPYSVLTPTPPQYLKPCISDIASIPNLFWMFPSFLCSQKPDCPLMTLSSLQPLQSWLCFLTLPVYHGAWRQGLSSSLLAATFCAFSSLLQLSLLRIDYSTHRPLLVLPSVNAMATSLHFMMNVSSGLLSHCQYCSSLNSGQCQHTCGLSFQTWFALFFQRSHPPPYLNHSLPWWCPKALSTLKSIIPPYSERHTGHSLTTHTISGSLARSPCWMLSSPFVQQTEAHNTRTGEAYKLPRSCSLALLCSQVSLHA